jgi:hypothetical protein
MIAPSLPADFFWLPATLGVGELKSNAIKLDSPDISLVIYSSNYVTLLSAGMIQVSNYSTARSFSDGYYNWNLFIATEN